MISKNIAVECRLVGKTYRLGFFQKKVTALSSVSLSVLKGETFGLLGPNGAGKTTLLKILMGIVPPTSGEGAILQHPLGDLEVRRRIGYLPENPYFYFYLTGEELLHFTGELFGLDRKTIRERSGRLLKQVGLIHAKDRQLRTYSKGMLQRVGIAQALINDPELIFLDEPMSGLDPIGRKEVKDIILDLKQAGKTIFFNSHILSDVEALCHRVGILNKGRLVAIGSLAELCGPGESLESFFIKAIQQNQERGN